ncbi:butyrophilin subfamily 1 member A1-like isoform X2 [Toxotes jaculatrix]|uniref:butyrophilin subfamily 1 member A1-like isoform X2 n=1 Tax=Toxotes jaculatrix TaxID=941984 RepID=UPI001B3AAB37|nr:butyrophilin subfamily 1 member A1-like isoform X2 [Toxotes jaculatrix]
MFRHLLLLSALLSCCPGESSAQGPPETVQGPPETVQAFVGGDIILPCTFNITASGDVPTVEWSKDGLEPNVVFLYRDGCETHEMKNPAFEHRTSFVMKNLKDGDISLRISNVQLSDAGTYQCMRLPKDAPRDKTTVKLVVVAVSEPKLSVVSAEGGEVTLQCEATCWLPEPEIRFQDDQGELIQAEDPKRDGNTSACFTVTRRATLQPTATSRVTCTVQQPGFNQSRATEILIAGGYTWSTIVIAVVVSLLTGLACGAVAWWKCGKHAAKKEKLPVSRQQSDQSTVSDASERKSLLNQRDTVDNLDNANKEQLIRELDDLRSKLCEKDKIIHRLQQQPSPQLSPVVCQQDQPTLVPTPSMEPSELSGSRESNVFTNHHSSASTGSSNRNPPESAPLPRSKCPKPRLQRQNSNPAPARSVQRSHHHNSSPDVFPECFTPVSTSEKKRVHISRSMSESCARPDPNHAKHQRRCSLGFQPSALTNNRYDVLADLTEESDRW